MGRAYACVVLVLLPFMAGGASAGRDPTSGGTPARRDRPAVSGATTNTPSDVLAGRTAFAFDLYQRLRRRPGNLFFSPHSISAALAMTYAGARGRTAREMAETLRLPEEHLRVPAAFHALNSDLRSRARDAAQSPADAFSLHTADALWGQTGYPFHQQFLTLVEQNYGATLRQVDFKGHPEASRATINRWAERETGGRIGELLPPGSVHPLIRLFLTDTIYFKVCWKQRFSRRATRPAPFRLLDGAQVQVDMMYQMHELRYADGDGYKALDLPYQGDALSMVVLLPDLGRYEAFEGQLTGQKVKSLLTHLDTDPGGPRHVIVAMPKFRYASSVRLKPVLSEMGMPGTFTAAADFSGVSSSPLWIDDVYHSAFVAVDEDGTEAAAGTGVGLGGGGGPRRVRMDRPFIFLIRDIETGTILFLGRLLDPRA
jgi:serpin B